MRSDWAPKGEVEHILAALQPQNRLACEISLFTGLRINDVLALKPHDVIKGRFTVREQKTGKTRSVYLPKDLQRRAIMCSGMHYVFEHRTDGKKHRTRQAVFKDLRRAASLFRLKQHVSPHSLRKVFAVEEYKKYGNLKRVQKLLNHSDEAVTLLYALADRLNVKKVFEL